MKGLNALELVFMMFILIVVTLVVIRIFTTTVAKESLPDISDFRQTYNYDREKKKCADRCEAFLNSGCEDLEAAVSYCQQKVSIDIDGNFKTGEKGHGGVIAGLPYCEDGLYCFHIYECACGSYVLNPENCLQIMKDYYEGEKGLPSVTANSIILSAISYGTCNPDPRKWGKKLPVHLAKLPDDHPYGICDEEGKNCIVGADYWWKAAGYGELAVEGEGERVGAAIASGFKFSCFKTSEGIKCEWYGCPSGEIVVALNDGSTYITQDKPSGSYTFRVTSPGVYYGVITCGENSAISSKITIS